MAHHIQLSQFEGPLDLLLHLISKAQVDISEIFISEITAQYMEYMEQIAQLDMDRASEFIAMAATLLYIKSRALLPKPGPTAEEEDPEQALIRQIREYKLFKQAGLKLNELLLSSGRIFGKLPEEFALPDQVVNISGATIEQLFLAFTTIITRQIRNQEPITREVLRDEYTVTDRISYIRGRLASRRPVAFSQLFEGSASKEMLVSTFMAVLEMVASGELRAEQNEAFGDIMLCAGALS